MKTGWRTTALGAAFQTVTGNTPPKSQKSYYGDDVPLIKPPELTGGLLDQADDGLSLRGAEVARVAPENSVLISCIGILGKVGITAKPVAFNQQINAIYPNYDICDPRFIFYQSLSPNFRDQLLALASGTTVAIVNKSRFNSIEIVLPPLEEQKRIVAVLDEAFEGLDRARANAEANLADARELFVKSVEREFCGLVSEYPRLTFGEISTIKGGKRLPKGDSIIREKTPYPYISIKDFNDRGSVDVDSVGYLRPETRASIKNYIIKREDLFISIAGTIGKTGIVPTELDGANLTENAARMVFKSGIFNKYVYFFTLTDDFHAQAGLNTRTAAQPKLALERLKTITLPVAPLEVQHELSSRLSLLRTEAEAAEAYYRAKLQSIETLRQSLLQKAFSGELT